jgi:hypothetical protein
MPEPLLLRDALMRIGSTGLKRMAGNIYEELLTELQGAPAHLSDERPRQRGKPVTRGADR